MNAKKIFGYKKDPHGVDLFCIDVRETIDALHSSCHALMSEAQDEYASLRDVLLSCESVTPSFELKLFLP